MTGNERREKIIQTIQLSQTPVSGETLAGMFHVSRQVIVQDIALLRAADYNIISTNRGYLCSAAAVCTRIFKVYHTDIDTEAELNAVVDCGGTVADVFVDHDVYGRLRADLNVSNRRQVKAFIRDIESGISSPLKNITQGYHYHTVTADSEETLDEIEEALQALGFLA